LQGVAGWCKLYLTHSKQHRCNRHAHKCGDGPACVQASFGRALVYISAKEPPIYPPKSPIFPQKSNKIPRKSPSYPQRRLVYVYRDRGKLYDGAAIYPQKSPRCPQKSPIYLRKRHKFLWKRYTSAETADVLVRRESLGEHLYMSAKHPYISAKEHFWYPKKSSLDLWKSPAYARIETIGVLVRREYWGGRW